MTLPQILLELRATQDFPYMLYSENKLSPITLPLPNKPTSETQGAQLHIMTNNPVKFHDSAPNTFGATCDTRFLSLYEACREKTMLVFISGHICFFSYSENIIISKHNNIHSNAENNLNSLISVIYKMH